MTGHGLEQAVIDAAAKISARTLAHPFQRDVVALARQSQGNEAIDRTTVERVIQSLSPTHLVRGGMPGNPTVALTVSGWLRSNLRPRIAAMVECVLRAYRRKAEETAGAFEELLVGSDLEAAGLVPSDVGLLASCGSALQLFTSPSGLAAASPLANVRIICPWDIDRLLELADAEAFFSYRTKYDLARAIALQRLQLSATGDVKRTVDEIYRRASPEWPPYRAVEVELRRSRVSPAAALADDFVKLVGGAEPVRIALTFRGLHLASLSAPDHEAILAAVRGAVAAYMAAPTRTHAPPAVVLGDLPPATQNRAVVLLEGVLPQLVAREPSGSAEFRLGPWLLELADATTLEDVVVALSAGNATSAQPTFPPLESPPALDDELEPPVPDDSDIGELTVGERIGSGGHADVYKVHQHRFDRDIAAKFMRSEDEAAVLGHARALARGRHPAFVHLYGVTTIARPGGAPTRALLMEYIGGDDLANATKTTTFTRDEVRHLARTLLRAMKSLHHHGGCHGDLHNENIRIVDHELRILDLYHRPSILFATTKTLAANQEQDRRECRQLILKLLEASDFGGMGTAPYEAFQAATRSRTIDFQDLEAGLDAALSTV